MKSTRLYQIDFARNIDTVVWEYTTLSEHDRELLAGIKFVSSFDYVDKQDYYNLLVISTPEQMSKYLKLLNDNLILHFVTDKTMLYLTDKFDTNKIETKLSQTNHKIWVKFRTTLDEWLLINQTLDNVLDIINEKGLDKIRPIDKKFLDDYEK